jgi:NAD(P)-dependent dehydrogenase (short-subunit alcohol dehydrogenase family)
LNRLKTISELISLEGKTALITGAAAGIGRAIAYRFAEAGAGLLLADINQQGLQEARKELIDLGHEVSIFHSDLADKNDIERLWGELKEREVNILVNNVGIYPPQDFAALDDRLWQQVMDTNLNSALRMSQKMITANLDKGGVIINLGSIEAILPFADDLIHYDITKAGVIALTRGLAKKYGKKGFRVNVLLPGGINTPGTRAMARRIATRFDIGLIGSGIKYQVRIPLGRRGSADEVATAALFLASDMSSYIQGALIPVDGGFLSS